LCEEEKDFFVIHALPPPPPPPCYQKVCMWYEDGLCMSMKFELGPLNLELGD